MCYVGGDLLVKDDHPAASISTRGRHMTSELTATWEVTASFKLKVYTVILEPISSHCPMKGPVSPL